MPLKEAYGQMSFTLRSGPELPSTLKIWFWDCDFSSLTWEQHGSFIIRRILDRGDWDTITWLRRSIGDEVLRDWFLAKSGGGLDPPKLRFWGLILDLPSRWSMNGSRRREVPSGMGGHTVSFHLEVLSEQQRAILPALGEFATANGFYLGGGTAVALYLGHRRSVDFDLFTRHLIEDPLVLARVAKSADLPIADAQTARGTLHGLIEGVQVSFFQYPYPDIGTPSQWSDHSLELASLDDLACMKLAAIAQRAPERISSTSTPSRTTQARSELLDLYRRKYSTEDIGHVLVGLTYFEDAEAEPSPEMLHDMPWEDIKRRLREWTEALAQAD